MPVSLHMYTFSFLPGFMYMISRRSKRVRSHSFFSSDETICFLPLVSASFTRLWYRLTNPQITSVFLRGLAGNAFFQLVWCSVTMLTLLKRSSLCSRQVVAGSLGAACPQHSYSWRVQAFFFDGITLIALFHLSFWFRIFQDVLPGIE